MSLHTLGWVSLGQICRTGTTSIETTWIVAVARQDRKWVVAPDRIGLAVDSRNGLVRIEGVRRIGQGLACRGSGSRIGLSQRLGVTRIKMVWVVALARRDVARLDLSQWPEVARRLRGRIVAMVRIGMVCPIGVSWMVWLHRSHPFELQQAELACALASVSA